MYSSDSRQGFFTAAILMNRNFSDEEKGHETLLGRLANLCITPDSSPWPFPGDPNLMFCVHWNDDKKCQSFHGRLPQCY